jgi:hypothetical protein
MLISWRFLVPEKYPLFLQKSSIFLVSKASRRRYSSREILMFFTGQKPVYNPWLARVTCVALGKNTLFLP